MFVVDFFDDGIVSWFVAIFRDISILEGFFIILFCGVNGFDILRKKFEIIWFKDGEIIIFK